MELERLEHQAKVYHDKWVETQKEIELFKERDNDENYKHLEGKYLKHVCSDDGDVRYIKMPDKIKPKDNYIMVNSLHDMWDFCKEINYSDYDLYLLALNEWVEISKEQFDKEVAEVLNKIKFD